MYGHLREHSLTGHLREQFSFGNIGCGFDFYEILILFFDCSTSMLYFMKKS